MTSPLRQSDTRKDYDRWHLERSAAEDSQLTLHTPWHAFVQRHLQGISGKRILEIASGRGHLSQSLAQQGAEVIAGDFSIEALQILNKDHKHKKIQPVNMDAECLPISDASVDMVISCETIEHILHPQQAIREFRRVLKRDGTLILTCPSYLNFYGLYRIYLKLKGRPYNSGTMIQPRENWLFSLQVAAWLKKNGFKIILQRGSGHYILKPGSMPKSAVPLDESLKINRLLRLFALHSFFIARVPA